MNATNLTIARVLSRRIAVSPRRSTTFHNLCNYKPGSRYFVHSTRRLTKAIINPKKADDGTDMIVQIMPRAADVCTSSSCYTSHQP